VERDRILTIPNLISFARLLGVPLFLYLFLVADRWGWAVVVLAVGGTTDWVDGFLARRLGQVSRLGELMDPLADRLYILATLLAFTVGGVVPWIFTAALLARDAVLLGCIGVLKRYGFGPLPVHYLGKAATAQLLLAFPILLLAKTAGGPVSAWSHAIGWGLAWWGVVFYWISALFYLAQAAGLIRAVRRAAPA
jgi:cardiolipin synthase (CMP-forming)